MAKTNRPKRRTTNNTRHLLEESFQAELEAAADDIKTHTAKAVEGATDAVNHHTTNAVAGAKDEMMEELQKQTTQMQLMTTDKQKLVDEKEEEKSRRKQAERKVLSANNIANDALNKYKQAQADATQADKKVLDEQKKRREVEREAENEKARTGRKLQNTKDAITSSGISPTAKRNLLAALESPEPSLADVDTNAGAQVESRRVKAEAKAVRRKKAGRAIRARDAQMGL